MVRARALPPAVIALVGLVAVVGSACAHGGESGGDRPDGALHLPDVGVEDAAFADGCGRLEVTFTQRVPSVVVLIDQSGSMASPFLGTRTRFEVVRDALVGPSGVLPDVEKEMRVGATLFHSNNGFAGGTCPILTSTPIALGAAAPVRALLDGNLPGGETPSGDSIDAVAVRLAAFAEPGPKYIVVATDGEPDTCAAPNPKLGQHEAVAAAQTAFTKGIGTFVLSVGVDVSLGHLQDMANAGAGQPLSTGTAKYYRAADAAALLAAFHEIIYGVRSCLFELDGKVKLADSGTVTLDGGAPLVLDDPDGWRMNGESELELLGAACTRLKSGGRKLAVVFPCGGFLR